MCRRASCSRRWRPTTAHAGRRRDLAQPARAPHPWRRSGCCRSADSSRIRCDPRMKSSGGSRSWAQRHVSTSPPIGRDIPNRAGRSDRPGIQCIPRSPRKCGAESGCIKSGNCGGSTATFLQAPEVGVQIITYGRQSPHSGDNYSFGHKELWLL